MEGGQENSLIQNFFSQYNLFTLGKMRRCEKSYLFMELKNQNKTGDEDASTTFSYRRFMSFCSPLWADWWHCFAPFSLVFNSILPAKAACSSQINPHPSCTFYPLHPPPHPSHLPSCRSQVLQDTDVQFGMFSARCQDPPISVIIFFRFYPKCTPTSSVGSQTSMFSMGYGNVSAFSELM